MADNPESSGIIIIPELNRLTEFQFNEPIATPSPTPVSIPDATLAQATITLDDPRSLVWISATVSWSNPFGAAIGIVSATFTILRNGIPLYSVTQSVLNPAAVAANVFNVARILFVDQPFQDSLLRGILLPPKGAQVTYTLASDSPTPTPVTVGPITLSLAEIKRNI